MPKVPVLADRQSGLAGANLDLPGRWENSVGTPDAVLEAYLQSESMQIFDIDVDTGSSCHLYRLG
jgi:hypothetical protein